MIDISNIKKSLSAHQSDIMGHPRKAALLLPLVEVAGEWQILFEVRGKTIRQAGETSFPGGGIDKAETALEAALRETFEEIGLSKDQIEVLGEIDYTASEKHVVYCFVGKVENFNKSDLRLNPTEVSDVYTVPLHFFLEHPPRYYDTPLIGNPAADFPFAKVKNGVNYPFYALQRKIPFYELPKEYDPYVLWGYTASFVENFINIIQSKGQD